MIVEKVLNNNIVLSKNKSGQEVVLMGKGLGFQKKPKEHIDATLIEKEFIIKDTNLSNNFQELLGSIAPKEFELVKKMIDMAESQLNKTLSPNIYLTLTDHIHTTLKRYQEGITVPNPLLFETKKFYNAEYQVAKAIAKIIEEAYQIQISDDEIGFITFHLVTNESIDGSMDVTLKSPKMMKDILSIISKDLSCPFDENSLNYQRLVTHLQFFTQRVLKGENAPEDDTFLYDLIQNRYPKAFACVKRIDKYLNQTNQIAMSLSEQIYLTIHIEKILIE